MAAALISFTTSREDAVAKKDHNATCNAGKTSDPDFIRRAILDKKHWLLVVDTPVLPVIGLVNQALINLYGADRVLLVDVHFAIVKTGRLCRFGVLVAEKRRVPISALRRALAFFGFPIPDDGRDLVVLAEDTEAAAGFLMVQESGDYWASQPEAN